MDTDARPDPEIPAPPPGPTGWVSDPLRAWINANRGRFTDDALMAQAIAAGHPEAVVRELIQAAIDAEVSAPVRARARRIITVLYLGGYAILVAAMLFGPGREYGYGGGEIGSGILTFALGTAFLVSVVWLRRGVRAASAGGALPMLLSVPVILWLGVSGLCVATGLPFGQVSL